MTKIIFTIPKELQEDLDKFCKLNSYNRSEFIRYAIREFIYKNKQVSESKLAQEVL